MILFPGRKSIQKELLHATKIGSISNLPDGSKKREFDTLQIERRRHMNIVVWKSPKMLRGILKKLFKV